MEFEIGDILLIRSGYTARYHELETTNPQRLVEAGVGRPTYAGVEQTEEMKAWLHDRFVFLRPPSTEIRGKMPWLSSRFSYFAAVVGDAPAFECWPSTKEWKLVSWPYPRSTPWVISGELRIG